MPNWGATGKSALAGAGIGTAILPGIGTAVGAAAGGIAGLLGLGGGDDPQEYHNPYEGQQREAAYELQNNNYGTQAAQQAQRVIGRKQDEADESIESNPNIGRNAAVTSRLKDKMAAESGNQTAEAYQKGAEANSQNKVKAAGMLGELGREDAAIDQENYGRRKSQEFGNSFMGGLLKDAVGFEVGKGLGAVGDGSGGSSGGGSSSSSGK